MFRKLSIKYLLMYLPVTIGIVLFSNGVVNLWSSLLLFLGGYIAVKNTFDYRLVKRNIKKAKTVVTNSTELVLEKKNDKPERVVIRPKNAENMIGIKRIRRYSRVRRKY